MKKLTNIIKNSLKATLITSILSSPIWLNADDTEVFFSENVSKPNIMFVMDISGSMKSIVPNSGELNETTSHTIDKKIAHINDDAEQAASGGGMLLNQIYMDLGYDYYDFRAPQRTGLRFQDTGIPSGAVITNAYIQFEVKETSARTSTAASFIIKGEASSNAARFSNSTPIHTRTIIPIAVNWNPPVWNRVGDRNSSQRTPDLTKIVQNIIDRSFWSENNGIVFIIEGTDSDTGSRVAKTFDEAASTAPSLHVEYEVASQGGDKTRLEVMQLALRRVLEQAPDNVKVGLMNYGQSPLNVRNIERRRHHAVSGVAFPISDINALVSPIISSYDNVDNLPSPSDIVTVRDYLPDVADTWSPTSWTPIVDSLYEAAIYFRGEKVHYGDTLPSKSGAHPSTYNGPIITQDVTQVSRDYEGAPNYISPIESSCQSNYIVLMTDGAPTYLNRFYNLTEGPFSRIRGTSSGPQGPLAEAIDNCKTPAGGQWPGRCGEDITNYISTHDNSDAYDGDQLIKTFAIGFGAGISANTKLYLKSLATVKDDPNTSNVEKGYYDADSAETLANAFKDIFAQVAKPSGTLASPGYSVNVKSGLEHEKDIYIPVFDRKNTSRWSGNLKKFRLVDVDNERLIRGKNNLNAVDDLGGFTADAWDYWSDSDSADGLEIEKGGVAGKLDDPKARKLYSNLTTDQDLTSDKNALNVENIDRFSNSILNIPSTSSISYRKKLVNFIRGWKNGDDSDDGEARKHMGDMLHSEPIIITYTQGSEVAGKSQYIFAGTNEGYLHAFDAFSGEEKFAFMPKKLLKNIDIQMRNEGVAKDHKYGIDGSITYWHSDLNKDGNVNNGEKVYLYFGLRRGGSSYYALDISDIDNPKIKWVVSNDDHASMGQSWSIPYLGRVMREGSTCLNGTKNCKEVVIISGGYDDIEDRDNASASTEVNTRVGKNILMFDADNGSLIWSLQDSVNDSSQITDSIPGGLRYLDTNNDWLIDRLYFGDTGANVWRVDLPDNKNKEPAKLIKLATLQGGVRQGSRKFYNEPDVSKMKIEGKSVFMISIGSGFRAHPMDMTIDDKFFILTDQSPYSRLDIKEFKTITTSDLSKINISGSIGSFNVTQEELTSSRGWEVSLPEDGEKVLSTALTFDGVVVFTTLVPQALLSGAGVDQCAAPATQGRLYSINILTGKPGLNLDPSNDSDAPASTILINSNDISTLVSKGEIPGKPQVIFNSLKIDKAAGTCQHPVDIRIGKKLTQATGYDACRLESVYWSDPVFTK